MSQVTISGNASGTGVFTIASPNSNNTRTLTLPDGTGTFTVNGVNSNIVAGTAVASTSGTSIDFTGIPSWVKRITVMFNGVSTNGTSAVQVQLGYSGGIENTGYTSVVFSTTTAPLVGATTSTSGFLCFGSVSAATSATGTAVLTNIASNTWVQTSSTARSDNGLYSIGNGTKTLSGTLDRVRITTVNGTDTFDAGSINILYE